MVQVPSTDDFLQVFGIEPVGIDLSSGYFEYQVMSADGNVKLSLSFSAIAESFQVVLQCFDRDVVVISSESVRLVEIRPGNVESAVHVEFDLPGSVSEAMIVLRPEPGCHWWTLRG